MSKKLPSDVQRALLAFGHRRLKRGEIFILAKVIADRLPLGSGMPDNIRTYSLNLRNGIDGLIYGLSDFIHLPAEDVDRIYTIIDNVLLWRMSVAFAPSMMMFSGDAGNVVDEATGILRYVDVGDICAVGDITQTSQMCVLTFTNYLEHCQ